MIKKLAIAMITSACLSIGITSHDTDARAQISQRANDLEIDRQVVESSPVLQRWLENPPDLLEDIYNIPSFNTKLQLGITSRDNSLGIETGVSDVFVGRSPLTLNAGYQTELSGRESELNADLRYYLLPLGSYWNVSPVVGYRQLNQFNRPQISGLDVGVQGILVLSPHSSEIRLSHTFTAPNTDLELSKTILSTSYAITSNLRLGTKIEWRRSPIIFDSRVGFLLELAL